jgi:radical SAM protein with 4Fe4S-binding SPASM domain
MGDIRSLVDSLDIGAINFGTGESILHPDFTEVLDFILQRDIKLSLTSNGLTVLSLDERRLKQFHDIDISLDLPIADENDSIRGKGSYAQALSAIDRCKQLRITTSIACCMTNRNFDALDRLVALCRELDVNLRVNIYKPVHKDELQMNYEQFWHGIALLFGSSSIVSCSEPIVSTVVGSRNSMGGSPCGHSSIRIRPDRAILPCVYWRDSDIEIEDLRKQGEAAILASRQRSRTTTQPRACADCEYVDVCRGGCFARRSYTGLEEPDRYCYVIRGESKPSFPFKWARAKDFVHSGYLCTIIVEP